MLVEAKVSFHLQRGNKMKTKGSETEADGEKSAVVGPPVTCSSIQTENKELRVLDPNQL